MTAAPELRPAEQAERLLAVRSHALGEARADGSLARVAAVAARAMGVPVCLISVLDGDALRFVAAHGVDDLDRLQQVPGLCASAVLGREPLVVPDAWTDPLAEDNPLVTELGVRFYAGVRLTTGDGDALGVLCVLGREPREVSAAETALLEDLAALVVDQLELRREAAERLEVEELLRRDAERLAAALQASLLPPTPPTIPGMEVATRFVPGEHGLTIGGDFLDVFRLGPNGWGLLLGDVCGKGARAAALTGLARWTLRGAAVHQSSPSAVLRDLNQVLLADGDDDDHFCTTVYGRLELDVCGAWVTLATSGHPQPILIRHAGLVERRGIASLPLGMFPVVEPVDDRVGLGPGDALVFYTDGIIESRDGSGELFGTARLQEVLKACIDQSADAMAEQVVQAARAFAADDLSDDAAVLIVRVPAEARGAGIERVAAATGVPAEELELPGYPHGGTAPAGANDDDV